jgi:hypothetical protein
MNQMKTNNGYERTGTQYKMMNAGGRNDSQRKETNGAQQPGAGEMGRLTLEKRSQHEEMADSRKTRRSPWEGGYWRFN